MIAKHKTVARLKLKSYIYFVCTPSCVGSKENNNCLKNIATI